MSPLLKPEIYYTPFSELHLHAIRDGVHKLPDGHDGVSSEVQLNLVSWLNLLFSFTCSVTSPLTRLRNRSSPLS